MNNNSLIKWLLVIIIILLIILNPLTSFVLFAVLLEICKHLIKPALVLLVIYIVYKYISK